MLKKLSLILVLISFVGCKESKSLNTNDVKTGLEQITELKELPVKIYPMNIKLDFGSSKEQSSIKIYECVLEYKNKSYVIKGSELKHIFTLMMA